VPSPHVRYWGFGSTGATCIGIGYALLPDRFDLFLSAPRAIAGQLSAFAEALPSAVRELHDLLAAEPEAPR
jgi:carnitine O-acetyltransferase